MKEKKELRKEWAKKVVDLISGRVIVIVVIARQWLQLVDVGSSTKNKGNKEKVRNLVAEEHASVNYS